MLRPKDVLTHSDMVTHIDIATEGQRAGAQWHCDAGTEGRSTDEQMKFMAMSREAEETPIMTTTRLESATFGSSSSSWGGRPSTGVPSTCTQAQEQHRYEAGAYTGKSSSTDHVTPEARACSKRFQGCS